MAKVTPGPESHPDSDGRIFLEVAGIRAGYPGRPVLDGVTVHVAEGSWWGMIGPNGSGKTTLLRTLSRYLPADGGHVYLERQDLANLPSRDVARRVAMVSTNAPPDFDFTVAELVLLGRTPHLQRWERERGRDWQVVERALAMTGITFLAERRLSELSAGERQRVLLARALAQEPRLLLLDEPTAHLDLHHQIEIMELLDRLRLTEGMTILSVMHDLNLAALYCHRLVLLQQGRVYAVGSAWDVITPANLHAVYGCEVEIKAHPRLDVPQVTLLRA